MSVVKINALTVPEGAGDELAGRFAKRLGAVDGQPGFEEFQLLRPTDDRTTWLVYTRWADDESFQAWMAGAAFGRGHQPAEGDRPPVSAGSELWQFEVEQRSTSEADAGS